MFYLENRTTRKKGTNGIAVCTISDRKISNVSSHSKLDSLSFNLIIQVTKWLPNFSFDCSKNEIVGNES